MITASIRRLTEEKIHFQWGKEQESSFKKLKEAVPKVTTISYFDPHKQTILRTEARFNEGIAAGLFQMSKDGIKPVHFISRAFREVERTYSQTEKDALVIRWATQRLRIYLIGAPNFKIVTAHKPLLPMFNKPNQKMPQRIEKWIMGIQGMILKSIMNQAKMKQIHLTTCQGPPLTSKGDSSNSEQMVKHLTKPENGNCY